MDKLLKLFATLLIFFTIVACEPQPTVPVVNGSAKTLVILSGGLGSDQTADIYAEICLNCPNAEVISVGDWDGYKADFIGIVNQNRKSPNQKVVFIGHSFGGYAVDLATEQLQDKVEYLVFVDPVKYDWGNFDLPQNIGSYDYFLRTDWLGPRAAKIPGAAYTLIKGGHNTIPHDDYLINMIIEHINTI
jgi:pimeloyl-ACP methyl ester carboxylesterase